MGVSLHPKSRVCPHMPLDAHGLQLGQDSHLFLPGDGLPMTASCICCSWRMAASVRARSLRASEAAWGGERGGESAASYSTKAAGRAARAQLLAPAPTLSCQIKHGPDPMCKHRPGIGNEPDRLRARFNNRRHNPDT